MAEAGKLHPGVTNVFPLDRYGDAFEVLTGRHAKGKVVLEVA